MYAITPSIVSYMLIVSYQVPLVLGLYVSNLSGACLRCLCYVVECEPSHACSDGYCGPFYIPRVYWADAGRQTQPDDDPNRQGAFEDCAKDYYCSLNIVRNYMARYGKDCNGDGVTDCYDFMMIHYHGGFGCSEPLADSAEGRKRIKLYNQCRL